MNEIIPFMWSLLNNRCRKASGRKFKLNLTNVSVLDTGIREVCRELALALHKLDIGQTVGFLVTDSEAEGNYWNSRFVVERLSASDWDIEVIPGLAPEKYPGIGVFRFFGWIAPSDETLGRRLIGCHSIRHEVDVPGLVDLLEKAVECISFIHPKVAEGTTLHLIEAAGELQPELGKSLRALKRCHPTKVKFVGKKVRKELSKPGQDFAATPPTLSWTSADEIWVRYLLGSGLLLLATWDHSGLPRSIFLAKRKEADDVSFSDAELFRWNGEIFVPFENEGLKEFLSQETDPEYPEEFPPYPGGPNYCNQRHLEAFFPEILMALDMEILPDESVGDND